MTLRKKTIFIIGVIGISLLVILSGISYVIVLDSFTKIEENSVKKQLQLTRRLIDNDLANMSKTLGDWAQWTATYDFMAGTYSDYIAENLMDSTFVTLKLHLILFLDINGTLVLGKAVDIDKGEEVPLSEHLKKVLNPENPLLRHASKTSIKTGILNLPEGPLLVVAHQILTSEGEGPALGTLIMGRYLNTEEIERLAQLTNLLLTIWQVNTAPFPPDVQTAFDRLSQDIPAAIHVSPLSSEIIAGYVLLKDIYDQPAIIIKASILREISMQGRLSVLYFIGSLFLASVILGATSIFLIEKAVLSPLTRLSNGIENIRKSSTISVLIDLPGQDELANLAQEINAMLTALKHSQNELEEREQRYRRLIENSPLGIFSVDLQGRIIDINAMLAAIFGAPSGEAVQGLNVLTSSDFVQAGIAEDFTQCLSSGKILIAEERFYISSWGKQADLLYYLTPTYTIDGVISGAQAIVEDITERKWAEKSLRETEAEQRSLFKNLFNGLAYHKIILDERGQPCDYIFLEINEAYEQLFGLGKEVIGKRVTEVFLNITDIEPDLIQIFGEVALTGEERRFEFYFAPFETWYAVAAYSPEKGYFIALYEDITERKLAEETLRQINEQLEQRVEARTIELQQANKALQELLETLNQTQEQLIQSEKMAALGGLVAGMAHEINTPLGVAITAASYLERQTQDIEQLYYQNTMKRSDWEQYLGTSKESTKMLMYNLQNIANQVRGFKQVSVQEIKDQKKFFSLKNHIETILLGLKPTFQKTAQSIRVNVNCPDDLILESYPIAFSQILTNFIMNSLIHGFENRSYGEIVVGVQKNTDMVQIVYHDNGKGMTEEERLHIFEPFYTTKRTQGGMGLGLHIVFNLVTQLLQGQIRCESEFGNGTTFTIQLPE
ncbi:integral membrane sensor signal transduction histidine kinase [Candidatus Vecturithrix granuli]|uniref:histidine kinase n=1 Tax=Vecturithrix granuli TaxID=1499967 RepID=A0A081C1J7_VECG1|nr:integral membrane sensor signal transduction histidine kinase [Candidatus Vecturithrix granuli]